MKRFSALAFALDHSNDPLNPTHGWRFEARAEPTLVTPVPNGAPNVQLQLAMRHVLIARSLERIGDNAVDIAEQAAFLVSAELREFTDASRPRERR